MQPHFILPIVTLLVSITAFAGEPQPTTAPKAAAANVLIIGASSLIGLEDILDSMARSRDIPMKFYGEGVRLDDIPKMLGAKTHWDYLIMDAWHFGRGRTASPDFPDAVTHFVKQVRAHSPDCKIILFAWWLPSPQATNEDVMNVFHRCVDAAKPNHIWVATTGPAFTEARLARPDLNIVRSKTDAHPAPDGTYLNACSLFALLTGQSPVGLPAQLTEPKPGGKEHDFFSILEEDATYLQSLAWKVYQRESDNVKPAD